ncbi:reductase [Bacillus sp. JCM 19045]|nr:reductase [Bacillus sp. JCM 19045]
MIDVAGRDPEDVRRSVDQLKDRCKMYVYISSVSAYKNLQSGPVLESDALHELDQDDYASNKATSEVIVNETFYDRSLIIRPGLIVGPDDSTDRFTYWPWRMKQGGNVLVPDVSENKDVQFIDVRDLSRWILQLIEQGQTGTFNATGPQAPLSFRSFLERCQELVAPQETKLCWVNEETLQENDVQPWIELPFWLPDSLRMNGLLQVNSNKAIAAGLTYRSLDETIIDTLNWSLTKRTGPWQAGMSLEKESQLLTSVPPMK